MAKKKKTGYNRKKEETDKWEKVGLFFIIGMISAFLYFTISSTVSNYVVSEAEFIWGFTTNPAGLISVAIVLILAIVCYLGFPSLYRKKQKGEAL